jgi:DNA-binding MarR family transcriptional regulator
MNSTEDRSFDSYRSFQLLSEITGDEPLSQRELSRRLGIAVGLVNSYLKNLVAKGYVRVKAFPKNRYAYLLTPTGITEKSRLACRHLSYFTGLYTVVRQDYLNLFRTLEARGVRQVLFCGVDEVAEIAYLSLRETGIELAGVVDDVPASDEFFGVKVVSLEHAVTAAVPVVITSLKRNDLLGETLRGCGVNDARIMRP